MEYVERLDKFSGRAAGEVPPAPDPEQMRNEQAMTEAKAALARLSG